MTDNVTSIGKAVRKARAAPDYGDPQGGDGDGGSPRFVLPAGAPIRVLGKEKLTLWILDHVCQLHGLKPRDLGKGELLAICGGADWLVDKFPRYGKPLKDQMPPVVGFDQADAQESIINACSSAGIFSPQGNLFGRGAHRRSSDDALMLHIGNKVLIIGAEDIAGRKTTKIEIRGAGVIDGKVYPAKQALPPPAAQPSTSDEANRLRALFGKWYFADGEIAHLLLLGWVGHAMMCGAFGWRSHVWLTGETAAGKSTLQKLIRAVLAEWGLFTEDASEAAVRQTLDDDTLPVMIDEAEADDRAERQQAMINLARKASSGAKMHRGSADHQAKEFTAQSAFLFSSILHAPLDPQDRNRFAILPMRTIPLDAVEPDLDLRYWREAGRRMHRRMVEQWPRFDRTLADYKDQIRVQGFQGRWRDTFGALLACADLLLYDVAPRDESSANEGDAFGREVRWVRQCVPMMDRGALEAEDTTTRCLRVLTSTLLPAASGMHQETVGQWIARAMEFDAEAHRFNLVARSKLKSHGLRVVNLHETAKGKWGAEDATFATQVYVLVASRSNTAMRDLFRGSKWYDGGWTQALAHARYDPEARPAVLARTGIKARFAGTNDYAVAVPIEALIGPVGAGMVG
jgi:hypothetical protein